jgi:hypothetical protein
MSLASKLAFIFVLVLKTAIFNPVFAQEPIVIGSDQEDISHALKAYDGKYYIVGTTRKDAQSAQDYYLILLQSNGTVEKRFRFGFPRHDVGNQVIVDKDGVFILGSAYDWGFPNVDMHLFKMNGDGEPEWERFYGTEYQDLGLNAIRTNDGGFGLIGNSNSQLDGGDVFFVKTDAEGNMVWQRLFGPKYVDYGFSLVENSAGEFVLAGTENGFYLPTQTDFVTHDADALLIKTNANGDQVWYKKYGGTAHDWAKDIILAPGGGYYVCGSTQSFGTGSFDVLLMKVDENGNEIWKRTFGGPEFEYGEKMVLGADGNLYIAATSASFSDNKKPDHYIIKTDLDGNTIWTRVLGTDESDYSSALIATPDSGIVFTGWSKGGTIGKTDIVLYRLSKDGDTRVISGIQSVDSTTSVLIYPNPARESFNIDITSPTNEDFTLTLYDLNGRELLKRMVPSNQKNRINHGLTSGVYFYRAEGNASTIYVGKLIVQH